VGLVNLLKIQFTLNANLLLVPNKLAVGELIWRVLDVRVCLFSPLPTVEVHFERRTVVCYFLSVNVTFEV